MSIKHRVGAYWGLIGRYRAVFRHFWTTRAALDGTLFSQQEAEFLPGVLTLQEKPVSSTARLTGRLLMALVAAVLIWSSLGQIDIIVNANGKVIPSARTQSLASVDVASVRALHVEEGQVVRAGEILIELDTSSSDAERDKATGEVAVAALMAARSQALIAALATMTPPRLPPVPDVPPAQWEAARRQLDSQYRDLRARLGRIDGEIQRYRLELPLASQRARDYEELASRHDVSTHAYLEKEQARIDLEGQLTEAIHQREMLLAQARKEAHDTLTEGGKSADASRQDALRAGSHSKLLKLRAPLDGTVQQLTVHTVGGVVPAAQPLMLVVPREQRVEIEAFLENRDIGFVREGQSAEVKIDAFDYTHYGTVPGRVSHVSRDAIQDDKKGLIYAVKVVLDKALLKVDGADLPLSAGMSVNVEIKTGQRRVIEYVLSPLLQHQRESLHER